MKRKKQILYITSIIFLIALIVLMIFYLKPRQVYPKVINTYDSLFVYYNGDGHFYSFNAETGKTKRFFKNADKLAKENSQYDSNHQIKDDNMNYLLTYDNYEFYNTKGDLPGDIYVLDVENSKQYLLATDILAYNAITDGNWLFTSIPEEGGHFYCYRIIKDSENKPIALELVYNDITK